MMATFLYENRKTSACLSKATDIKRKLNPMLPSLIKSLPEKRKV